MSNTINSLLNNQNLAIWIGSLATLGAVIIALFLQEIRAIWDKPKLTINIRLAPPDCHKTTLRGHGALGESVEIPAYYLRFWIKNDGSQKAEQAQVFFSKLEKRQEGGSFQEVPSFLPMNLVWAHSRVVYADIAPSMGKHCDLGHVDHPTAHVETDKISYGDPQARLYLDLEVLANNQGFIVEPGAYRAELQVAANNVTPLTKIFELNLSGSWFNRENEMFEKGISINELNGV